MCGNEENEYFCIRYLLCIYCVFDILARIHRGIQIYTVFISTVSLLLIRSCVDQCSN